MEQTPDKRESSVSEARELKRVEREIDETEKRIIGFQEFMGAMMVVATILMACATGLSAWATWRSEQIARHVFAISDRPYIGIESVRLNVDDPRLPYALLDYRNFGRIPAENAVIEVWASIDGQIVSFEPTRKDVHKAKLKLGALSPATSYLFAAYFPPQYTAAILAGSSDLSVEVIVTYSGSLQEPYCYRMNFHYFAPLRSFDPSGGSDK